MKTNFSLRRDWMIWLLILGPLIPILLNWDKFPDKIPTHWNASGEVDSYGGKGALFIGPLVNLGVYLLLLFLPRIDPRKKNYELFSGAYWTIRLGLAIVLAIVGLVTIFVPLGYDIDVALIIPLTVTGLFLLLGNQFGRLRHNYFVGIRTPWTLNNEEVWKRTHRLAGKVWVAGSLIMLPLIFLLPAETMSVAFFIYIAVLAIVPIVYSLITHKSLENGPKDSSDI
ncbi:MAG TPA: SdpI family protein [Bacteroidia bacterium]|nr:SdpI family protein [Bacteroidia bacterium]